MRQLLSLLLGIFFLSACNDQAPGDGSIQENSAAVAAPAQYVVLNENLQQLKDDFNAATGKIRLVFISGPTCGICLRGMADLNDAFLAAAQKDNRLQTFLVHVPALGAKEKHVADTIPLLRGPNIRHYWEDTGIIGILYRDAFDVPMYVWDFWSIYGPDARWDETLPPLPGYFEHQLGVTSGSSVGFSREQILNPERFAGEVAKYLALLPEQPLVPQAADPGLNTEQLADGTVIPFVSQPRGLAIGQHIRGRGGYINLKRIQRIKMHGQIQAGGQWLPLTIDTSRVGKIQRSIGNGATASVGGRNTEGVVSIDTQTNRGLPADLENLLLASFDFDGPLVEWPDKGHQAKMLGMEKIGKALAWKLDFIHSDGQHWHLFINSHGGGIVKADLLDENEQVKYTIRQSDYRETSGFTFPHRIEYLDEDGVLLAVEAIDKVIVIADDAENTVQSVSH